MGNLRSWLSLVGLLVGSLTRPPPVRAGPCLLRRHLLRPRSSSSRSRFGPFAFPARSIALGFAFAAPHRRFDGFREEPGVWVRRVRRGADPAKDSRLFWRVPCVCEPRAFAAEPARRRRESRAGRGSKCSSPPPRPPGRHSKKGPVLGNLAFAQFNRRGLLRAAPAEPNTSTAPTPARFNRGQHQEPDQAQPAEREAPPAQTGPVRSELRTYQKAAEAAAGTDEEAEALRLAIKKIDKAAAKGVLHSNSAARRKSRLVARMRELATAES